jgi:ABC-type multidrug transport system ATPase subunit
MSDPAASPTAPVVELRDVVAVLGGFPVLAGADLVVGSGEIVLLRGPNGAGKTSLLRLCAGLLPLERGDGKVFGLDLATQRTAIRPRVGLLGHQNGLYRDLTVAQNVRFWGATVGATDVEVDAAMERLGLFPRLADVVVSRLSAGQKRRTATLRDAAAAGATIVVASHELERAGSLATRAVDVVGGRIAVGEAA